MNGSRRGTAVRALARAHGIQLAYTDNAGTRRVAPVEHLQAVLTALGVSVESDADAKAALRELRSTGPQWPVNIVAWNGRLSAVRGPNTDAAGSHRATITLETGEILNPVVRSDVTDDAHIGVHLQTEEPLPYGIHVLKLETLDGVHERINILSAPRRCFIGDATDDQTLGVFLPLYAARSHIDWGVGDLSSLAALGDWARAAGARWVGTLPLLASYLDEPFDPSPYAPVSRLFWNELYCDVSVAEELALAPEARHILDSPALREDLSRLGRRSLVDYRAAIGLKRQVIEQLARATFDRDAHRDQLQRFIDTQPNVDDYARFRAAVEATHSTWQSWPARMRAGDIRDSDFEPRSRQYHLYAQWLVQRQLERLSRDNKARGCELYLDLPVGVHGGGYDVWRRRDEFATGLSVGAPPDDFFRGGQNWGFPPLHPQFSRRNGHSYFRAVLANHLRFAGMLRIDHIMALHRLYLIPDGASATQGVYVQYPAEELFAVAAMESHRFGAKIVGENLGTVPSSVTRAMKRHGVLGMSIAQIDFNDGPEQAVSLPDQHSLAALNTHDMPTFAAWWTGDDIQQRRDLGLLVDGDVDEELADRKRTREAVLAQLRHRQLVGSDPTIAQLHDAILTLLAAGDADVLMINLEDLWQEQLPQNVPGISEYPSWRKRAARSLEQIIADASIRARVLQIAEAQAGRALDHNRDRIVHRNA